MRSLCFLQFFDHFLYLQRISLYRRLISAEFDLIGIGETTYLLHLYIYGQVYQNRALSSGICDVESFLYDSRNVLCILYKI